MATMSALETLLTELSEHSQSLQEAVKGIRELLSGEEPEEKTLPEKKSFTIEEVRALLLDKRKTGFKEEIKALLIRHGAERLTDIDPAEYAAMMKEAEEIGK